jgi:hypothetical protein
VGKYDSVQFRDAAILVSHSRSGAQISLDEAVVCDLATMFQVDQE